MCATLCSLKHLNTVSQTCRLAAQLTRDPAIVACVLANAAASSLKGGKGGLSFTVRLRGVGPAVTDLVLLQTLQAPVEDLISAKVDIDPYTRRRKGTATIIFSTVTGATQAVSTFNNTILKGCRVTAALGDDLPSVRRPMMMFPPQAQQTPFTTPLPIPPISVPMPIQDRAMLLWCQRPPGRQGPVGVVTHLIRILGASPDGPPVPVAAPAAAAATAAAAAHGQQLLSLDEEAALAVNPLARAVASANATAVSELLRAGAALLLPPALLLPHHAPPHLGHGPGQTGTVQGGVRDLDEACLALLAGTKPEVDAFVGRGSRSSRGVPDAMEAGRRFAARRAAVVRAVVRAKWMRGWEVITAAAGSDGGGAVEGWRGLGDAVLAAWDEGVQACLGWGGGVEGWDAAAGRRAGEDSEAGEWWPHFVAAVRAAIRGQEEGPAPGGFGRTTDVLEIKERRRECVRLLAESIRGRQDLLARLGRDDLDAEVGCCLGDPGPLDRFIATLKADDASPSPPGLNEINRRNARVQDCLIWSAFFSRANLLPKIIERPEVGDLPDRANFLAVLAHVSSPECIVALAGHPRLNIANGVLLLEACQGRPVHGPVPITAPVATTSISAADDGARRARLVETLLSRGAPITGQHVNGVSVTRESLFWLACDRSLAGQAAPFPWLHAQPTPSGCCRPVAERLLLAGVYGFPEGAVGPDEEVDEDEALAARATGVRGRRAAWVSTNEVRADTALRALVPAMNAQLGLFRSAVSPLVWIAFMRVVLAVRDVEEGESRVEVKVAPYVRGASVAVVEGLKVFMAGMVERYARDPEMRFEDVKVDEGFANFAAVATRVWMKKGIVFV
ncbi:hypothetical protein HK101_006552 [Irineochytrium annulatum]|nr:hypothetical protein HK101_006552 [Irineochytrium annulatum]